MMALRFGIPTLNGYSGAVPPRWAMLQPDSPGYASAAADWVSEHNVQMGLCTFDAAINSWRLVRPSQTIDVVGENLMKIERGNIEDALAVVRTGFYDLEPGGRWTDGRGIVRFATPVRGERLRIGGTANPVDAPLRVLVNDRVLFDQRLPINRPFSLELTLNEPINAIEIDSATFVPELLGINEDTRQLGIAIRELVLE